MLKQGRPKHIPRIREMARQAASRLGRTVVFLHDVEVHKQDGAYYPCPVARSALRHRMLCPLLNESPRRYRTAYGAAMAAAASLRSGGRGFYVET
jgi:hypothetical protein